jgi:hypothetical protein
MGASVADSGVPFLSTIEGEYQLNKEMAKRSEADAHYNAQQRLRAADQLRGEQIAAYGMSGVELEGSPMEIIERDQVNAELEAMNIIYSGKMDAAMMRRRAALAKKGAYENMAMQGVGFAISAGAFKGGGGGAAPKGGFDSRSTGTGGYTMSENTSAISNKGTEYA